MAESKDSVNIEDSEQKSNDHNNINVSEKGFSKSLHVGGQKVLVVDHQSEMLSGEGALSCCVIGSPEHVAALRVKIDELKLNSARLEQERAAAIERSENVGNQLDKLVNELKKLGHENTDSNSEQTIHATVHTYGHLQKLEIIADDDEEEIIQSYDRLMRKPRVRQYWHKGTLHREADERHASYTELFFDLIFVAVIRNLGHTLVSDISGTNLERFILTFYPIWRINQFSPFFISHHIMGTHASDVVHSNFIFIISYVIVRLSIAMLYVVYAIWIPMFRTVFIAEVWGIIIPTTVWFISIFSSSENVNIVMWIAVLFDFCWQVSVLLYHRYFAKKPANHVHTRDFNQVDAPNESTESSFSSPTKSSGNLSTPHKAMKTRGTEFQWKWIDMFTILKQSEYRTALNIEHFSERVGLFAIIAVGESILGVVYVSTSEYPDGQLAKAILGLIIAYGIHWIYFDVDASRQFQHALRRHVLSGVLFGYVHYPLLMSLIAFGSSLGSIMTIIDYLDEEENHASDVEDSNNSSHLLFGREVSSENTITKFPESLAWLFCASLATAMYSMATIGILHKGLDSVSLMRIPKYQRITIRFVVGTIFLLLPLAHLNTLNLVAIVASLSIFLVVIEAYGRLIRDSPLVGNCDEDIIGGKGGADETNRYIRWRWGTADLRRRTWSRGFLKRTKNENEKNGTDEKNNKSGVINEKMM
ncbi:10115_t:CDS:10 [Diversispora eburnea]|uniref:10115_t:CDS:1 n=1 Tax=Diversispora eburnea TaxID=1213867 RepID=A0A9N8V9A8_9GLOM|nr:10115_t:CDS:10 [Diversispora eburnea]